MRNNVLCYILLALQREVTLATLVNYGHLVGMSQNGAKGMAESGFTYDEILKHYYKGIELN